MKLPMPAECLRMPGIPFLVMDDYRPDRMKFAVFAQEMLTAKMPRRDVPDPHTESVLV